MSYSYSLIFSRDSGSRQDAIRLFSSRSVLFVDSWELETPGQRKAREAEARKAREARSSDRMLSNNANAKTKNETENKLVIGQWRLWFEDTPSVAHFQFYGGHLIILQKQMMEWKPQTVKELFRPGYKDRITWYATMLGILVAVLSIVGIITSLISAVTAIISLKLSLEMLTLQKFQMNVTRT
jgi:hypothetical protein